MTLPTIDSPVHLVPGNCYFLCHFYDRGLIFPLIQTFRYVGCIHDAGGDLLWLFREPPEPREHEADHPEKDDSAQTALRENQLHEVLDVSGLQRALAEIAHFHPVSAPPFVASELQGPQAVVVKYGLPARIESLLTANRDSCLHMYLRFTEHGLFVKNSGDFAEVQLHLNPLREPEIERAALGLFAQAQITASTDYLSDSGRSRTLSYPLGANAEQIASLCSHIFVSVFGMRTIDELVIE